MIVLKISIDEINTNNKIIDIRDKNSFNKLNYPGSINIPRLVLLSNPSDYISKYETVYLICDYGKASLLTADILNKLGYNCYSIEGGIKKVLN